MSEEAAEWEMEGRSGKCVSGAEIYMDPKQDGQFTYNVAFRRVLAAIVVVEKAIKYYIF